MGKDCQIGKSIFNSHLSAIRESLEEGRLAVFVGSGISRADNPDYPLWPNLCNALKKDLVGVDETDSLKLAQRYEIEFSREHLVSKLRRYFDKTGKTKTFEKILGLNPHCVITTNWDNLFNQAVDNNPTFWNVIANDGELVSLHNEQKIIKIHGDFNHGNIVFTENDYLNYSDNFPLIESYVKSILSTHVVLFLGYSFSDPDLKQILNWINKKSVVLPAKYFISYEKDPANYMVSKNWENYLESWKLIVLSLNGKTVSELLDDISRLAGKAYLSEYEIDTLFDICKSFSNSNSILLTEFQEYFPFRIDVLYTHKGFLLVFYANATSFKVDGFKEFFESANKLFSDSRSSAENDEKTEQKLTKDYLKEKALFICKTISKLGVNGIALNTTTGWKNDIEVWFPDSVAETGNYISFDNSIFPTPKEGDDIDKYLRYIYNCIQLGNYPSAREYCKKAIKLCGETKDFYSLFICYFNMNHILDVLSRNIPSKESRDDYKKEKIDISQELLQYPVFVRKQIAQLRRIFSFEEIYHQVIEFRDLREKVENSFDEKTGQQVAYFSNLGKYTYSFKNLLHFVYENALCIEKYKEFKIVAKDYFNLSFFIARKQNKDEICLSQTDLFVAIKYLKPEELYQTLSTDDSTKWIIKLSDDCLNWFIYQALGKCLLNAAEYRYRTNGYLFEYVQNILMLLAHLQISDDLRTEYLNFIAESIKEISIPIKLIESINSFLYLRYSIFGADIGDSFIKALLNSFIDKIVCMKVTFEEFYAIATNNMTNIYSYLNKLNISYTDSTRMEKLVTAIDLYELEDRIGLLRSMVLYMYFISDNTCKDIIRTHVRQQNYFDSEKLNGIEDNFLIQKILVCSCMYHTAEIQDMSEKTRKFIKNYIISKKEDADLSYLTGYYKSIASVEKDKRDEKVNQVIELLKGLDNART